MKKAILLFVFILFSQLLFAQFGEYSIQEVLIEMDTRNVTYYAEVSSGYRTEISQVKKLYKKATLSDIGIGYGKYNIKLNWLAGDMFNIVGTSYLLKIPYASQFTFSFGEWMIDTASSFGINGKIVEKK